MNKYRFNHQPVDRRRQSAVGKRSTAPKTGIVPKHPLYAERMKTLKLLAAIEAGKGMRPNEDW